MVLRDKPRFMGFLARQLVSTSINNQFIQACTIGVRDTACLKKIDLGNGK